MRVTRETPPPVRPRVVLDDPEWSARLQRRVARLLQADAANLSPCDLLEKAFWEANGE